MRAWRSLAAGLVAVAVAVACSSREEEASERPVPAAVPADADAGEACLDPGELGPRLGVVTFNIRSGLGPRWSPYAGRAAVERRLLEVARAIAEAAPAERPVDLVGLQEVDFGSRRSGFIDQAGFIARELEERTGERYEIRRGITWTRSVPGLEVRFGNALLSRHPVVEGGGELFGDCERCVRDDTTTRRPRRGALEWLSEPRGTVSALVDVDGRELRVVVTHLEAFSAARRERQAAHLAEHALVEAVAPTLLVGDLNAEPGERVLEQLGDGGLRDARRLHGARHGAVEPGAWDTYPADDPRRALDAILLDDGLALLDLRRLEAIASDHLGLYAEVALVEAHDHQIGSKPSRTSRRTSAH